MQWDGSATLPPWAEVLLPICGWVKSGNTFTPRSEPPGSNVKTGTFGVWLGQEGGNWLYKTLAGAVANFEFALTTGQIGVINWTIRGVWQPPVDQAVITPTYPAGNNIRYASDSQATTWDGNDLCVQTTTVASGNPHLR